MTVISLGKADRTPAPEVEETATSAAELAQKLELTRALTAVRRTDELARMSAEAEHTRALADLAERSRTAEAERAAREASRVAGADLNRLYLHSRDAGVRTRIAATMSRSGEARALRLEQLRRANLLVLIPILLGFGLWSTTGVQAGAVTLMHVTKADPTWWVLWILEPVLIGVVVWNILLRARLSAVGGTLSPQATVIAATFLAVSVLLNLQASWPAVPFDTWQFAEVGPMLAHAIAPLGAAAVAHLIGVNDDAITAADPWNGEDGQAAPVLDDLLAAIGGTLALTTEEPVPPADDDVPATAPAAIEETPAAPEEPEPAPVRLVQTPAPPVDLDVALAEDEIDRALLLDAERHKETGRRATADFLMGQMNVGPRKARALRDLIKSRPVADLIAS